MTIRSAARSLRARLRGERGFTMPATLAVMTGVVGFSAAAIGVATADFSGNNYNTKTKQAVAAAEAGIADYLYHLNQDNAYWAKCTNVETPSAVNQKRSDIKTGATVLRRAVPGTTNTDYALELLPANGQSACSESNAAGTMIDTPTGTFRIRATGRVKANSGSYTTRQLTATFKRRSFLDFLYFTDYETSDPAWYQSDTFGLPTRTPKGDVNGIGLVAWASANCDTYWKDGRDNLNFNGEIEYPAGSGDWYDYPKKCNRIQFAPGDAINGPLHTNDDLLVCGSPTFGRTSQDKIEVSGQTDGTPGWRGSCSGASPNFVGTFNPTALKLTLPVSNTKLEQAVDPAYKFTGRTTITLNGANMQVTNTARGLSNSTMALPTNGVIYVEDGTCGETYEPLDPYGAPNGCGDVYLKGSYSRDLTIAAEKDILIQDDVTRSGDYVLGLIANQFVRVFHPITIASGSCANDGGPGTIRIDAAILALQHSFTVDSYYCGDPLGTLTVNGVIAQRFRGPVGTGGSSVSTGYLKDYNYDDRLQLRQPPFFLDPVQSSWRIQRQTE